MLHPSHPPDLFTLIIYSQEYKYEASHYGKWGYLEEEDRRFLQNTVPEPRSNLHSQNYENPESHLWMPPHWLPVLSWLACCEKILYSGNQLNVSWFEVFPHLMSKFSETAKIPNILWLVEISVCSSSSFYINSCSGSSAVVLTGCSGYLFIFWWLILGHIMCFRHLHAWSVAEHIHSKFGTLPEWTSGTSYGQYEVKFVTRCC